MQPHLSAYIPITSQQHLIKWCDGVMCLAPWCTCRHQSSLLTGYESLMTHQVRFGNLFSVINQIGRLDQTLASSCEVDMWCRMMPRFDRNLVYGVSVARFPAVAFSVLYALLGLRGGKPAACSWSRKSC